MADVRVGAGHDLHRLVPGRRLRLGGIEVPHDRGAAGHSDADAALHALTDALLGAAALGDIGRLFPDSDPAYQDADSSLFVRRACELVRSDGWTIQNVDLTIMLEKPKLAPLVDRMRASIASVLAIEPARVSVQAKTAEGLGAIGRGEAVACHCVALLRRD